MWNMGTKLRIPPTHLTALFLLQSYYKILNLASEEAKKLWFTAVSKLLVYISDNQKT